MNIICLPAPFPCKLVNLHVKYNVLMVKYKENIIKVPKFSEANGFYTTEKRSKVMSRIKGKNTKAELILRKSLWSRGVRYRKNMKKLPGTPDLIISKYKLVIFIDGEFWHGYNWKEARNKIKSNREYWIPKIERNMQRDKATNEFYADKGWRVIRFWEKEIVKDLDDCVNRVLDYLEESHNAG